jgi:thioredoxin reductase (NADPH)
MQQRALDNPKIEILWSHVVTEAKGADFLEAVRVKNLKTNEERDIPVAGLFFAIGHTPNTAFLSGQIDTDDQDYIVTKPDSTQTNIAGVFAAGDVQDKKWRQAVTAAGSGCMAALEAEQFLAGHG